MKADVFLSNFYKHQLYDKCKYELILFTKKAFYFRTNMLIYMLYKIHTKYKKIICLFPIDNSFFYKERAPIMKISTTSNRLKELLEVKQISQAILSKTMGISRSAMCQYISGRITPKQDKLYVISITYGVSLAWLMGYDVPMDASLPVVTYTDEEQDLIFKYRLLMPVGREAIQAVLNVHYNAYINNRRKLHKPRVPKNNP